MRMRVGAWCLLGVLGACGAEPTTSPAEAPAGPEPRFVNLQQLAVEVKQNLGRGALVNLWATW